ncbi:MAG: dihydrolipoyl dehydrogenase [Candidatus Bathyarchaeota archaeon]|nr:dihydrolipoyl dehydrogenase [Candidatus Bathyarchaeota archaeon]
MENFDVLVVGSGSGMMIANAAVNAGMKVALVEKGLMGGTCLNTGCIPSKMVIYPADIVNQIKHAERLGIHAKIERIDFAGIMRRTREFVAHDRKTMEDAVPHIDGLTFYPEQGEFIDDYTMKVGNKTIKAENIFLASGSRPHIPPTKGLSDVDYLTNRNVWDLDEAPESMIIVGGGFIAAEMAHFFSSMGVEVTVLSRSPRLLKHSEPEVSEILTASLRQRIHIETGIEMTEVKKKDRGIEVTAVRDGQPHKYQAEQLFVATGRVSNADILKVEKTGVEVDERGYIKVDKSYQTTKQRIWAFGDAIGKAMFRHVANQEAQLVWQEFSGGHPHTMDYDKVPYAVFSWPQVASVGLTEAEATRRGLSFRIGEYNYIDTAKGAAMNEEDGYVKIVLEAETYRILGASIIGPYSPILIQEVINVMYAGDGSVYPIAEAMHIHPALPEVVQRAIYNLRDTGHHHA